jgi:hypothetical protein
VETHRALLGLALALPAADARADWWSEHVDIHGFATSQVYGRWPDASGSSQVKLSSWRTELDIETDVRLYEEDDLRVGFFGVLRPVYDSVYEISSRTWGDHARGAAPSPQPLENAVLYDPLDFGAGIAHAASKGHPFLRDGACMRGEFCLGNADVGSLFSNELEPALVIDDVVFFGSTTAPWRPRSGGERVGGDANGETYLDYLGLEFGGNSAREVAGRTRLTAALTPIFGPGVAPVLAGLAVQGGTAALEASLTPVGQMTPLGLPGRASQPVSTPFNFASGALGSRRSFHQAPYDLNRREESLAFDCFDNAHPWCFVRDAFFQVDWRDTSVRLGRQQIVWGKTDAFRLQDIVNPIDLGYHNVFPELEDRRIPQLALDVIHSFGDVGPVEDLSLELAWNFDRFVPIQFGQCGEPYAYTVACQGRADAAAHQLFNFALGRVEQVDWTLGNTEPGMRVEFRVPEPSISLSFSFYYGHQDLPAAKFVNRYSAENPNPAAMLFLQGQGLGTVIEGLSGTTGTPWSTGFDPYDTSPGSSLRQANDVLLEAWRRVFDAGSPAPPPPLSGVNCKGLSGPALTTCAETFLPLALPWTAGEYVLRYPRLWTLGASLDYQVPDWDTILRLELAYDVDRAINNTAKVDAWDESDVFLAAIGIDRPTYFPFLNPDRTALLSFQTFFEHVMDYDGGGAAGDGMVVYETSIVTTFLNEHYWRNDSLILRNFVAYDWKADALILGPSFKWVISQHLSAQIGINLLFGGRERDHDLRQLCPGAAGGLGCIGDPATWNEGQWQALNEGLAPRSASPWWSRQGFADSFQARRDEFWVGFTYQF